MRIVLISLERAIDRRRQMAAEFARVGLDYEVRAATDARALTDEERAFVDRDRRRRLGLHPIPDGSLANTLSQRAAMWDLVKNGPEMMAVFEDDARFDTTLPAVLAALEARANVFDVVKLQRRNFRRPFIPTIPLPSGHWLGRVRFSDFGSEGYVITREAAHRLLERIPRMVREIDHVLSRFWDSGLNVFYVDPPVVREDGAFDSQIEETRSTERLAHRRVRYRQPLTLGTRLTATVYHDFRRRLAFRRLLRFDRTAYGAVSTGSPLPDVTQAATGAAKDLPTRSLRIAFVVPALFADGAERSVLRIAGGLIDLGHRIDILLFRPVIDCPSEVPSGARLVLMEENFDDLAKTEVSGIFSPRPLPTIYCHGKLRFRSCVQFLKALQFHPLSLPNKDMFEEAQFVANYVRKEVPDCIIPILPKGKVASLLAKTLFCSFPVVISSVRSNLKKRRRRENVRYRLLLDRSNHIVAVSDGVRSSVSRTVGVSPAKITTIYNPVVMRELQNLRDQAPDHPWLPNERSEKSLVILAAGRLSNVKDFPTLIRAFHRISETKPIRLIILGEGRQRTKLEELVRTLKLKDRVSLPGYVGNPYAFMSRASLFVLSSKFEGLPNVLIEALACGCPCVSTDCPSGPSEILDGGRIGPLVPVGDYIALSEAMESVLDAPPERRLLQRRADLFSLENSVARYEDIITKITYRHELSPNAQRMTYIK